MCDVEGKLNEWIKLFKSALKGHQTLFIIVYHPGLQSRMVFSTLLNVESCPDLPKF